MNYCDSCQNAIVSEQKENKYVSIVIYCVIPGHYNYWSFTTVQVILNVICTSHLLTVAVTVHIHVNNIENIIGSELGHLGPTHIHTVLNVH